MTGTMSWREKLVIFISTSAIPLNPSTKLIDVLLGSFLKHLFVAKTVNSVSGEGSAKNSRIRIKVYILCDGFHVLDEKPRNKDSVVPSSSYKKSKITPKEAENYKQFIENLRDRYENVVSGKGAIQLQSREHQQILETFDIKVIDMPSHYGFANGLKFALENLISESCEAVLVAQHDYVFVQSFPLKECVDILLMNSRSDDDNISNQYQQRLPPTYPPIEYIGVESLTTTDHYEVRLKRLNIDCEVVNLKPFILQKPNSSKPDQGHSVSSKNNNSDPTAGLELFPLHTWYDKTHLARIETYKRLLNITETNSNPCGLEFPVGSFIEDVFFNANMPSYPTIGTYTLKQNKGPVIYHLSGRKLVLNDENENSKQIEANAGYYEKTSGISSSIDQIAPANDNTTNTCSIIDGDNAFATLGSQFSMFKPTERKGKNKRFTGKCFKCEQKGHSAKYCPTLGRSFVEEESKL